MAFYVIVGVLAAFGALCILWVLFGALLTRPRGDALVCFCGEGREERIIRRYRWLRDLGLVKCPLVLLDSGLPLWQRQQLMQKCGAVRFYTTEKWIKLLEQERRKGGRAGNGNAAGDHCSGDLSEL